MYVVLKLIQKCWRRREGGQLFFLAERTPLKERYIPQSGNIFRYSEIAYKKTRTRYFKAERYNC
jgi:hypothetical protein